jgi:hypothetical protein
MNPSKTRRGLALLVLSLPALCLAGSINGRILGSAAAPPPKKVEVTIDQYACGTTKDADDLIVSLHRPVAACAVRRLESSGS